MKVGYIVDVEIDSHVDLNELDIFMLRMQTTYANGVSITRVRRHYVIPSPEEVEASRTIKNPSLEP
jgi:hypothetical protein